jgi:hypothetical protein
MCTTIQHKQIDNLLMSNECQIGWGSQENWSTPSCSKVVRRGKGLCSSRAQANGRDHGRRLSFGRHLVKNKERGRGREYKVACEAMEHLRSSGNYHNHTILYMVIFIVGNGWASELDTRLISDNKKSKSKVNPRN